MTSPAVIVFGEVLADIFPGEAMLGGAPFNVARHLQAFGMQPLLVTRAGNDDLHRRFLQTFRRYGMDVSGLQLDEQYPTGQVNVLMEDGGHRFEIADDQAYDHIDAQVSMAAIAAVKSGAQLTYFGTLAQRHAISRGALQAVLENSTGKKFLDINLREPWYDEEIIRISLQHADIVKLNEEELSAVAGMLQLPGESLQGQAISLLQHFQLDLLIVTAGAKGAWQVDRYGGLLHAEAMNERLPIVDTVGAGDAFAAVYIVGMLQDWPASLRLSRANQFAAAMCRQRGGVPDTAEIYAPFLAEWRQDVDKSLSSH